HGAIASPPSSPYPPSSDRKAGTFTLTAADGALHGTSSSLTVSPAAADHLTFTAQPGSILAGSSMSAAVTVEVHDAYDNLVPSNDTISLATTPSASITPSSAAASAGVATFTALSMSKAGSFTLAASDAALNGTSSSFTISA